MQKLNKLLNITDNEWPRVIVAWSMMFFLRFGFIVGWTTLIAVFLGRLGAAYLPTLFLANAVLMMCGAQIYRKLIHKIKREVLIAISAISASLVLLVSMYFINTNLLAFTVTLLIAQSVLLSQLGILLMLFNEDLFTPLESQRTFPIVESAEIFGGIAGGMALTLFAGSMPAYKFISLWILALIIVMVIVLSFNTSNLDIPKFHSEEHKPKKKFAEKIKEMKKVPFLKTLMIIVFFNWAIMNVVEFQYTSAVLETTMKIHGSDFATSLAQDLGKLHTIFNTGALVIQLIFASRIISSLGIASSIFLHPIVTILNLCVLTFRYGFFSAAITKGSFEITNLISTNAYNSSYYAIPHHIRDEVKEVLQGIFKPMGAIFGTLVIMLISFFVHSELKIHLINIFLLVTALSMAFVSSKLSREYTDMSEQNLSSKLDLPTRLNAIEILAQNGHGKLTSALQKLLKRKSEIPVVKETILKTLGAREDLDNLNAIIEELDSKNGDIRLAAVEAIANFHKLEDKILNLTFTRYNIIEKLKDAIQTEKNDFIKEKLIKLLYQIDADELTKMLIKHLGKENPEPGMIRALKLFNDQNLISYLEPFLNSKDAAIRSAVIVALWQFAKERSVLRHYLKQLLESKSKRAFIYGLETVGNVKYKEAKHIVAEAAKSKDHDVKNAAILALVRLEDERAVPSLVGILSDISHAWFEEADYIIASLSPRFKEKVKTAMRVNITDRINVIVKIYKHYPVEKIQKNVLEHLVKLYKQIGAHHESFKIEKILVE